MPLKDDMRIEMGIGLYTVATKQLFAVSPANSSAAFMPWNLILGSNEFGI